MWKAILLLAVLCPLVNCACKGCSDYTPVELDDPAFKETVDFVTKELNNNYHFSKYLQKIIEITGAEKSVCSDEKLCGETVSHRFNATVGMTDCLKGQVNYENLADCELKENGRILECRFTVTEDKKNRNHSYSSGCRTQRKS